MICQALSLSLPPRQSVGVWQRLRILTEKMSVVQVQFFLSMSNLLHMYNPMLLLTENDAVPLPFCSGNSFPIACARRDANLLQHLKQSESALGHEFSPVFLTVGDHDDLIKEMSNHPLLFSGSRTWVMPLVYATELPLRLDSNIFFYDETPSGGFVVYESYGKKS